MVLVNYTTRELTAKVVYYGPGLGGKTSNLQYIYDSLPPEKKGKMISLATKTDRTLFFDFLPLDLGTIRGMRTRIQLYTVPGQVFYNETRKLVLRGADGIVFVADSNQKMMDANLESFQNLQENLAEYDIDVNEIPLVLQYNKRDLPHIYTLEELNKAMNPKGVPFYEAVAIEGTGVHETLKAISKLVLKHLAKKFTEGSTMTAPVTAAREEKPRSEAPPGIPAAGRPAAPPAAARPASSPGIPVAPAAQSGFRTGEIPAGGIPLSATIESEEDRPSEPPVVEAEPVQMDGGEEELTIEVEEEPATAGAKAPASPPEPAVGDLGTGTDDFAAFGGTGEFGEEGGAAGSGDAEGDAFREFMTSADELSIEDEESGAGEEITEIPEEDMKEWVARGLPEEEKKAVPAPAHAAKPVPPPAPAPAAMHPVPTVTAAPVRVEIPLELAGGHGELVREVVIPVEFASAKGKQVMELHVTFRFHPKK